MGDVVDRLERREGGFSNDPDDAGGRTYKGISETHNPDLWVDGPPSDAQVRERYEQRYVKGPGFDQVTYAPLREQLIDYGVNSGPYVAVQKLQEILQVTVDGVLGPQTLAALREARDTTVCNQLVAARVRMLGKIVVKNPSQLKFLNGWLNRALEFLQ